MTEQVVPLDQLRTSLGSSSVCWRNESLLSLAIRFCYSESDAVQLPQWLRTHPSVSLVKPDSGASSASEAYRNLAGRDDSGARLPAQVVLEGLIREFSLDPPALTVDPVRFFADHLARSLGIGSGEAGEGDLYAFAAVVRRVQLAAVTTPSHRDGVERAQNVVRTAQYRDAILAIKEASSQVLDPGDAHHLARLALTSAAALHDGSLEELMACELTLALSELASPPLDDLSLATALVVKAQRLGEHGRLREELETYEHLIRQYGQSSQPRVRRVVAGALVSAGFVRSLIGENQAALATYADVHDRYGNSLVPELRAAAARALVQQANLLHALGRGRASRQGRCTAGTRQSHRG